MAVTVTNRVTMAISRANQFAGSHTSWSNLNNTALSDNYYATVDFTDGLGDGISHYIHLREFNFDIPSNATIDGVELSLERKASGTINDHHVRLAYNDSSIVYTTPKINSYEWSSTDEVMVYGSPTDPWNVNWTEEQIESDNFGAVVSVTGDLGASAAFIDSATITLYYHYFYNETSSGGNSLGGSATLTVDRNINGSGGINSGGHTAMQFDDIAVGGIQNSGLALFDASYFGVGGNLTGSTASCVGTYNITSSGGSKSGGLSEVTSFEEKGVLGGLLLGGSALISLVSPLIEAAGGVKSGSSISSLFKFNLNASGGLLAGSIGLMAISQVVSGGSKVGSSGEVSRVLGPIITGGTKIGSSATVSVILNPSIGGGLLSGSEVVRSIQPYVGGGLKIGGTSSPSYIFNPTLSSFMKVGGIAIQNFTDFIVMSGGIATVPKCKIEKLYELDNFKIGGIGRALLTPNILNICNNWNELICHYDTRDMNIDTEFHLIQANLENLPEIVMSRQNYSQD